MCSVAIVVLSAVIMLLFVAFVRENELRLNAEADLEVAQFRLGILRHPSTRAREELRGDGPF